MSEYTSALKTLLRPLESIVLAAVVFDVLIVVLGFAIRSIISKIRRRK